MATQTTKRGLRKPELSDYVNVVTDINNNMDNLDNAVPDTRTVNGHALTSNVTVTKGDVGLGNVDNTSDANKPVSNAVAAKLGTVPSGKTLQGEIDATNSDVSDLKLAIEWYTSYDVGAIDGYRHISKFVYGAVANNTASVLSFNDSTTRIRSAYFFKVCAGDVINITHGSGFVHSVNAWTGTPENATRKQYTSSWISGNGTFSITNDGFAIVTFANATDQTATVDLSAFDGTVTLESYARKAMNIVGLTKWSQYKYGTKKNNNFPMTFNTVTSRIRAGDAIFVDRNQQIVIEPGNYSFVIYKYTGTPTSGTMVSETSWSTESYKTDTSDCDFVLIVFSHATDHTAEISLDDFNGNVYIVPSAITELVTDDTPKREISILFVGNSLTQDGIAYLPYLLKNYYPEIGFRIYMWYNGGYTLAEQYTAFQNNTACQIFSVAENSEAWTNYNNSKTMASVLSTYRFDIVSLQEYFNYKESYTETDLADWNNCKDYITSNYSGGNGLEFITLFHAPLRSEATEVFNLTKTGIDLTLQDTICDDMIPNGIAVYRALSTDLDNLGDQGHLSPDGTHTQEGLPCLLQTYVTACWLFDRLGFARSVYGCPMRMTTEIYNTLHVPGPNLGSGVITGTDAQNLLTQEVAIKAYKEGKYYVLNNIFNPN